MSRLSLIVAMGKNRVIGVDGAIPWRLPNELQLFKRVTMGHHIIMGRKTWESIGRLLPGRTTVIVTRQKNYTAPGALIVNSLAAAITQCANDDEIFVIGGGELYREALPGFTSRLWMPHRRATRACPSSTPPIGAKSHQKITPPMSGTHTHIALPSTTACLFHHYRAGDGSAAGIQAVGRYQAVAVGTTDDIPNGFARARSAARWAIHIEIIATTAARRKIRQRH